MGTRSNTNPKSNESKELSNQKEQDEVFADSNNFQTTNI